MKVPSLRCSPVSTDNSSIDKAETSLDWQEYFSQLQDTTDALPTTSIFLYACESWTLTAELQRRIQAMEMRCYRKILHISYKDHACYLRGSPCQDPAGNWTTRRPPDHRKEAQTAVVWSYFPFIRSGQNHFSRHSERGKKTRQTEVEVGRQHKGMNRSDYSK